MSPSELPVVLKLRTDSMKHYVLSQLGHPYVDVEITEPQLESAIRVTGDFISGYFPREERLAVFNTRPLVPTYPLPTDAYWIKEVSWDPITTRIDDVFGAERYLFCAPGGTQLLTTNGPKACETIDVEKDKLVTPFGVSNLKLRWNPVKQPIQVLQTEKDYLAYTPNHPINLDNKFRMAIVGFPGMKLLNSKDQQPEIIDRDRVSTEGTWSIETKCGCYYASVLGKEFYLVHG